MTPDPKHLVRQVERVDLNVLGCAPVGPSAVR